MRIFTMLQSLQRLQLTTSLSATTTIIVKGTVSALMRNIVSLVLISMMMMMLMSENRTTTTPTTTIGPQWMTQAMMASPHTYLADQNEETITLKIKGDEQENWVTDMDDYTVVRTNNGEYRYAELSPDRKKLVPSDKKVGKLSKLFPKTNGWQKDLRPDKDYYFKNNDKGNVSLEDDEVLTGTIAPTATLKRKGRCPRGASNSCGDKTDATIPFSGSLLRGTQSQHQSKSHHRRRTTSNTDRTVGTLKNLVVLMKFKDHHEQKRTVPSKEDVAVLMNSEVSDPELAPTGSLKMIYWENSYGQLTIDSEVTDWINVSRDENYYANGYSGVETFDRKFQEALVEALDRLEDDDFDFTKFDVDGDNRIDSITFLTSGYGAEWGNEDEYGTIYQDRIWSHKWSIQWRSRKTGVYVTDYHVSPSLWGTSGSEIGRVGVIAHEIGHFLGLPDLYDTDNSGNGLGFFCMMANSWGYDGSQKYPPHMSAWAKIQLGWTTPQTPILGQENRVVRSEEYTSSNIALNRIYKIGNGEFGFPLNEYLLIEYRKTVWLKGGIAIYHVDEHAQNHNEEGYPEQITDGLAWPSNGHHYKVALLAADGNYDLEKNNNQGNSADLFNISQSLLPSTDSMTGPFPNSDSYQDGNIVPTGVEIYVTSDTENSFMSFEFSDGTTKDKPWKTLLFENLEKNTKKSSDFSFGSTAKVVKKNKCLGARCVVIKMNKPTSTMSMSIPTSSVNKLQVSFDFYVTRRFGRGDEIVLEYSNAGVLSDDWSTVQAWVKGKPNNFPKQKWVSATLDWSLPANDSLYTVLRFRTTALANIYIDNITVRGK